MFARSGGDWHEPLTLRSAWLNQAAEGNRAVPALTASAVSLAVDLPLTPKHRVLNAHSPSAYDFTGGQTLQVSKSLNLNARML